jgi:hypothetical protein
MSGQSLVYGIVDQLEDHMVESSSIVCVSNVHSWALAYGIEALKHLNTVGIIFRLGFVTHKTHSGSSRLKN